MSGILYVKMDQNVYFRAFLFREKALSLSKMFSDRPRMHYIDECATDNLLAQETILCLHGEPTWYVRLFGAETISTTPFNITTLSLMALIATLVIMLCGLLHFYCKYYYCHILFIEMLSAQL